MRNPTIIIFLGRNFDDLRFSFSRKSFRVFVVLSEFSSACVPAELRFLSLAPLDLAMFLLERSTLYR